MTERHYEIETKEVHVRFYGKHPTNYEASIVGFVSGNVAHVWGFSGQAFYEHYLDMIPDVMKDVGVTRLTAHVSPPHARLIRRAFRGVMKVELHETVEQNGRKLTAVSIEKI